MAQFEIKTCNCQDVRQDNLAMRTTISPCIIAGMVKRGQLENKITRAREQKGWSQTDLAKLLKVTPQTVQLWEREGGTAPKRARAKQVAELLGLTIESVMDAWGGNNVALAGFFSSCDRSISKIYKFRLRITRKYCNLHSMPHINGYESPAIRPNAATGAKAPRDDSADRGAAE